MKKLVLIIAMSVSLNAKAGLGDWFDMEKMVSGAFLISESINGALEKLRILQHEKLDVQTQWDTMCVTAFHLKNNLEFADNMLNIYHLGQPACIPLSNALKLQASVLSQCNDFYNKEVQLNFDNAIGKLMMSIAESQEILAKCYPFVNQIGF
jgi:hypothetical protein